MGFTPGNQENHLRTPIMRLNSATTDPGADVLLAAIKANTLGTVAPGYSVSVWSITSVTNSNPSPWTGTMTFGCSSQPCTIAGWTGYLSPPSATSLTGPMQYVVMTRAAPSSALGTPGAAVTGRTIEQTVSCKKTDGTTYSYTNTSDASAAFTAASVLGVAGLMCDTGDTATGVGAKLKTPGKPDVVIANPASSKTPNPQWDHMADPAKSLALATNTEWQFPVTGEPPIVQPAAPASESTIPGTPTPTGTDSCGMSFASVLDGSIMFRAVGCALSWAFVPDSGRVAVQTKVAQDSWTTSRTGKLANAVLALPVGLGALGLAPTDCKGPKFTIPLGSFSQDLEPMNACAEPMKTVAYWVKVALTIVMVIGTAIFIINPLLIGLKLNAMPEVSGVEGDGQRRLF
jgi:hypothetical protein